MGGGGGAEYSTTISRSSEGYREVEVYTFEPEFFPVILCIEPNISQRKKDVIRHSAIFWNKAYISHVNELIRKKVLFNSDLGKYIPERNLLKVHICDSSNSYFYHRFIYIKEDYLGSPITLGRTINYGFYLFWIRFGLNFIEIKMSKKNFYNSIFTKHNIHYSTVVAHEIGHALGLVHSEDTSNPLMNWNTFYCKNIICKPSKKDIETFIKKYIDLDYRYRMLAEPQSTYQEDSYHECVPNTVYNYNKCRNSKPF